MYCNSNLQPADDDDTPPPGFGPATFTLRAAQRATAATHNKGQQQLPSDHSHIDSGQNQLGRQVRCTSANIRSDVRAGAVRQFQKALSVSITEARSTGCCTGTSSIPAASAPQHTQQPPKPDYGVYEYEDSDYGCSRSRHSSRQPSSNRFGTPNGARPRSNMKHTAVRGNASPGSQHPSSPEKPMNGQHSNRHSQHTPPMRLATPDYGQYNEADGEYGSDDVGSSSSSKVTERKPQKGGIGMDSYVAASAAATQALSGCNRKGHVGQHDTGGRSSATVHVPDSARRCALEAELAAVREALQEAEARQVEAAMTVLMLENDNSTLQAQLQGVRQQKQQLETMLLFSGDTGIP